MNFLRSSLRRVPLPFISDYNVQSHSHNPSSHRRYSGEEYELLPGEGGRNSTSSSPPGSPSLLPSSNGHIHRHHRRRSSVAPTFLSLPCLPRSTSSPYLSSSRSCCSVRECFTIRRLLIFLTLVPVLLALGVLWSGVPPDYQDVREWERRLPQHRGVLDGTAASAAAAAAKLQSTKNPPPPGRKVKGASGRAGGSEVGYLRFPGHLWGHGLNNILQEAILSSYLAYASNRSYVFEDYVWSHVPFPYTLYDFALRPTRIPLNAFISGPTAGGEMFTNATWSSSSSSSSNTHTSDDPSSARVDPAPRAVSAEFWDKVCPPDSKTTVVLNARDAPSDADGDTLIRWWLDKLKTVEGAQCVEIDETEKKVFDFDFFGSSRILTLWSTLSASPILTQFTWSPLVHAAVSRNFAVLQPTSLRAFYDLQSPHRIPLPGLIAVHLRRGDYSRHCPRLAGWNARWNGFNQFDEFVDKFEPDKYAALEEGGDGDLDDLDQLAGEDDVPTIPSNSSSTNTPTKSQILNYYLTHCYPTPAQIVSKLHSIRQAHPHLTRVYILTNGWGYWFNHLKDLLMKDGWTDLKGSFDVVLDREQEYVGMAVDMAIAESADVFVGNGFSSLTSNIMMLRRARGLDDSTNRFL